MSQHYNDDLIAYSEINNKINLLETHNPEWNPGCLHVLEFVYSGWNKKVMF